MATGGFSPIRVAERTNAFSKDTTELHPLLVAECNTRR
jgi:hypothetical protein